MDHSHYLMVLLLLAPAFVLGWLCGWLWANRPDLGRLTPGRLAAEPSFQDDLIHRLSVAPLDGDGSGSARDVPRAP